MCGIVGFASAGQVPVSTDLIHRMCGRIVHRGPDDEGLYVADAVGLGMRRLAIIDIAGGRQPLFTEDRRIVSVCNGEIYNFRSLRTELESMGHQLATHSDVEVIGHLYESCGGRALERLRGMFALALWDARDRKLLLAIDRVGKKPLYYTHLEDGSLAFASELKALREIPTVRFEVDPAMLEAYLALGYLPAPHTIYRKIFKLSPGHYLQWCSGNLSIAAYWQFPRPPESPSRISLADAQEHLLHLLREAVRLRLVADVPLGAFLSGGVDSSAVVALMAEVGGQPPKTFAIGFDDASFSELDYARQVARHLGTDHHEEVVSPDAISDLPRIVRQFDEPFADASALPTYYLTRMARRQVTVALSGDGGDEVFGGYRTYLALHNLERLDRLPGWLRESGMNLTRIIPESTSYHSVGRRLRRIRELSTQKSSAARYSALNAYWPQGARGALLDALAGYGESLVSDRFAMVANADVVQAAMWVDSTLYMPGDILAKVDRMSMMNSLEVRCPLLDAEVIDFVATLPRDMKLHLGTTKYLLKKSVAQFLPRFVTKRAKHGFSVPVGLWLRSDLRDMFRDLVLVPHAHTGAYLDRRVLEAFWNEHQAGRRDNSNELWSVLVLELWMRAAREGN